MKTDCEVCSQPFHCKQTCNYYSRIARDPAPNKEQKLALIAFKACMKIKKMKESELKSLKVKKEKTRLVKLRHGVRKGEDVTL